MHVRSICVVIVRDCKNARVAPRSCPKSLISRNRSAVLYSYMGTSVQCTCSSSIVTVFRY